MLPPKSTRTSRATSRRGGGHALRLGLFALYPHSSILGRELALELLTASRQGGSPGHSGEELDDEDRWIVSEYGRLLAFPYMTSREQLEVLPEVDDVRGFLLRLVGMAKAPSQPALTVRFEAACEAGREGEQCALLAFSRFHRVPISGRFRARLPALMSAPNEALRATALSVVEYDEDSALVSRFAAGDWTSADSPSFSHLSFYGSLVLVRAAEEGLIGWKDAVDRMSAPMYGVAAERGGASVACLVARRIDSLIKSPLQLDVGRRSRHIEIELPSRHQDTPLLANVRQRPIERRLAWAAWAASEARGQHWNRDREFFEKFVRRLNSERAEIVMYPPSLEAFGEIVCSGVDVADQWLEWFMSATDRQLSLLKGVALSLAHAIRDHSPNHTAELLKRVKNVHSLVRFTHGPARVPLDAFVSWSAADTEDVVRLCFERLDDAGNDHEIAFEVLAALAADRDVLLSRFVDERWNSSEPEGMARALMVLGFSRPQVRRHWGLDAMQRDHGLVGEAWKAAKYAWDRDQWARHWFGEMCAARRRVDFWRYSVLFAKIVDARFKLWRSDYDTSSELMCSFEASIGQEIENRLKRWRSHREKKLFGGRVPAEVFRPEPRRWRSGADRTLATD